MKNAIFNPLAARELVEAVEYYDEGRRGLGDEFLHEVERAIAFLNQYPEAAPKVGREVRRPWSISLLGDLSPPQRAEQAMKGPEKAIEAVVRAMGVQSARLALSALPRALHPPVELAIRAVDRVMDLGLGLSRY